MSQTTIKELGDANMRHVDIASLVIGITVGLLNPYLMGWLPFGSMQRVGQVVSMCFGALTAAFTVATLMQSAAPKSGLKCRLGVRTGIRTTLWAGAALSVVNTLRAISASSAIDEIILKAHMWMTLAVTVASFLPSVLAGFVGGFIARPLLSDEASPAEDRSSPAWRSISRGLLTLAVLCLASPMTFLVRSPKVDPVSPVVQAQRPAAAPAPAPPPPFHFQPSKDLADAAFGQVNVDLIKSITGVDIGSPFKLAPDYSLLAYTGKSRQGQSAVIVYDLDWFREIAQFVLPTSTQSNLTWEPGLHRLACVTGSNAAERRVWILDLGSGRSVELPRPKNRDIPRGDLHWWTKNELAFFPTDEPPLVLDLENLKLSPVENSPYFNASDEQAKKKWLEGPREVLPTFAKWKPDVVTVLSAVEPPSRRDPEGRWSVQGSNSWAFVDEKLPVVHLLPQLPVKLGETLLCAPDASKLILFHDGMVDVAYMKVTSAPKWFVHAELPFTSEGIIDATAKKDISAQKVCAFIYGPLFNPLNAKCVGPNHNRLKAVLRLQKWTGHSATFVVIQRREDFGAADVVADLHTWENGELKPWRFLDKPDWWTTVGESPEGSLSAVPESASINGLEMPSNHAAVLNTDRWFVQDRPRTESKKKVAAQPVVVKTPAPASAPIQSPATGQDSAEIQAVKAFIEEHHRKASSGDLDAMMADYADLVDFMSRGRILRDRIQQDEINQRELWPRSTEAIKDGVTIESKGSDGWKATYSITFRNENTTGGWQSGVADLELEIAKFRTGFRITGHKAKVHDVTTGQGAASTSTKGAGPPAVKIRLPSPVWATTMNMRIGDQKVSVHEALALVQGRLIIHRTYRVLVDSNTPKDLAKQHPDGIISMQTAEIEGSIQRAGPNAFTALIGRQGWVQTPEAKTGAWNAACEAHAARMVGTAITFRNEGEDLVSGGTRFKIVNKQRK